MCVCVCACIGDVKTVIGTKPGFSDGQQNMASLNEPSGLAVGKNKEVYVADTNNKYAICIFAFSTVLGISYMKKWPR